MDNSVVIKGNKYGIIVLLDDKLSFDELKVKVKEKFINSAGFFKKASMGITFEGRELSDDQTKELLGIISDNSDINIVCVLDQNQEIEERFRLALERNNTLSVSNLNDINSNEVNSDIIYQNEGDNYIPQEEMYSEQQFSDLPLNEGQFYRGTLRSGQVIESDASIVILGDVNPGARVVSGGNVVILGSLKGTVYAGVTGDSSSIVVALEMMPMQIRIGDVIARSSDSKGKTSRLKKTKPEPKIAFVENDNIYIEALNKEVLNDIRFN